MTSILLDGNNDLAIIDNSFQFVTGEEEVSQKVKTVLKTVRGECFLNTSKGIPYITEVMGKNKNLNLISSLFKNEIISIESVETLDEFNISINNNRNLIINAKINGNIIIEEVL